MIPTLALNELQVPMAELPFDPGSHLSGKGAFIFMSTVNGWVTHKSVGTQLHKRCAIWYLSSQSCNQWYFLNQEEPDEV